MTAPAGPDWTGPDDDRIAAVRPFGYRHDDPIVERIGDRDLFLGNGPAAEDGTGAADRSFAAVLSLTRDRRPATTAHRPLTDGPEADWAPFAAAADDACRLVGDESLLVHCAHGVSRSAIICAVALSVTERRGLRECITEVQAARPPAVPHPRLHELAVTYVAAEK